MQLKHNVLRSLHLSSRRNKPVNCIEDHHIYVLMTNLSETEKEKNIGIQAKVSMYYPQVVSEYGFKI